MKISIIIEQEIEHEIINKKTNFLIKKDTKQYLKYLNQYEKTQKKINKLQNDLEILYQRERNLECLMDELLKEE